MRATSAVGATLSLASTETPKAVQPGAAAADPAAAEARRLPAELVAPKPADRDTDGADRAAVQPGMGPLKTFAQIPTEVMQEISRLREEAEARNVGGIPGRNDPTPMPASPAAIGAAAMPYDAA